LAIKSKEISRLVDHNYQLETTVAELTDQLSKTSEIVNDKENVTSYRDEIRVLRRENEELTQLVRKMKKQEDKTAQQLKNQQLLELEISNGKAKIKGLEEVATRYKAMEKQHQGMLAERAELSDAFHQLLSDCSSLPGATPVKPSGQSERIVVADIIAAYRRYQAAYALLMGEVTELKCTITRLSNTNQMLEGGGRVAGQDGGGAGGSQLKRMSEKNALLNQQVILCTSENTRLRSAIIAYDEEFEMIVKKINKVNASRGTGTEDVGPVAAPDILKFKNSVITELYAALSAHRDVIGKELGLSLPPAPSTAGDGKKRKLEGAEEAVDAGQSAAVLKEKDLTIADLRASEAALRAELYVFQRKCGTDVFPVAAEEVAGGGSDVVGIAAASSHDTAFMSATSNTRVLHMKVNPFSEVYDPLVAAGVPGKARQVQYSKSLNPSDPSYWLRIAQTNAARKLNLDEPPRHDKPVNTSGDEIGGNSNSSMIMDSSMIGGAHNTSTVSGGVDPAKMNQRLKAIFKEKIAQFREVVYLLTGYKVDVIAADNSSASHKQTIRLRSMYAENSEDSLLFQVCKSVSPI
jgi:hypothetical protein